VVKCIPLSGSEWNTNRDNTASTHPLAYGDSWSQNVDFVSGQPTTCYGCNEIGHLYNAGLNRRKAGAEERNTPTASWGKWRRRDPRRAPDTCGGKKEMAQTENTNTGTQHSKDELSAPSEERKQEGNKPPQQEGRCKHKKPQENEEGDIIKNQKGRAYNNEHAQTYKDEEEDKMEIYDEK
jgi:hypothetical protein